MTESWINGCLSTCGWMWQKRGLTASPVKSPMSLQSSSQQIVVKNARIIAKFTLK